MKPVAPRALALLAQRLEEPEGRTLAAWLDEEDQPAFRLLTDAGALVPATGPPLAVLCPYCALYDVAPERVASGLRGLCPECGYVPIDNASLQVWVPDVDWLLGRLRKALGMAARQDSQALVDPFLWKVGDAVDGRRRRRVLFARRLGEAQARGILRDALNAHVERDNGIIIGVASADRVGGDDLPLPYVHLAEMFRWRSGGLDLDESLWAWCLKPAHLRTHRVSSIFFDDYRTAIIDGVEYSFGSKQASFWEFMHAAEGSKRPKLAIMEYVGSEQPGPRELFRHNSQHMKAFQALVDSDNEGFYWLTRFVRVFLFRPGSPRLFDGSSLPKTAICKFPLGGPSGGPVADL
jgi:hypothetical protein